MLCRGIFLYQQAKWRRNLSVFEYLISALLGKDLLLWMDTIKHGLHRSHAMCTPPPSITTNNRVVTKMSSCQVTTTSTRGIKQLGISFGSIFLLFSNKSSQGPLSQQPGKIPSSRLLMTTLNNDRKIPGVITFRGYFCPLVISLYKFMIKCQHVIKDECQTD